MRFVAFRQAKTLVPLMIDARAVAAYQPARNALTAADIGTVIWLRGCATQFHVDEEFTIVLARIDAALHR